MTSRLLFLTAVWLLAPLAPATPAGAVTPTFVGFFDLVLFAAETGTDDEVVAGVDGGEASLVVAARLPHRIDLVGEVSLVGARSSERDSTPGELDIALERAILRHVRSDALKLSLGKYHTPLSLWNQTYHRGRWRQVSIDRPEMVEFDSRFLPAHLLGVMVEGQAWAKGWNVSYVAGLGDGRPRLTTRDDGTRLGSGGAFVTGLSVEPKAARGLRAGIAIYQDRLDLDRARLERLAARRKEFAQALERNGTRADETIFAAHLRWSRGVNELLGEYARLRHEWGGDTFDQDAFYLQVTYLTPLFRRRLTVYNRIEQLELEPGDPALRSSAKRLTILGARHDGRNRRLALKAELRHESVRDRDDSLGLFAQLSMTFF